jgi:hypothetical protein
MHRSFAVHLYSSYIYIKSLSSVFRCFPFISVFKTFIVLVTLPYVCPMFSICFEYPELPLLFLIFLYLLFVSGFKCSARLLFFFDSKLYTGCLFIDFYKCFFYVCFILIVYYENIIYVSEVSNYFIFL